MKKPTTKENAVTASEMIDSLTKLQGQAGKAHYARAKIANQLFANDEWVRSVGGVGPAVKALRDLLADVCDDEFTALDLANLYDKVPDEEQWKASHYNMRVMWANAHPDNRRPPSRVVSRGIMTPEQVEKLPSKSDKTNQSRKLMNAVMDDAEIMDDYRKLYRRWCRANIRRRSTA